MEISFLSVAECERKNGAQKEEENEDFSIQIRNNKNTRNIVTG